MKRIHVLNQNDYERVDITTLLSGYNGKYITNGIDNAYFYKVESMYFGSPTNAAIIDNFTNYIIGDGLLTSEGGDISNILSEDDLRLGALDFKVQGQCAFQVVYDYNGDLVKLYSIPVRTLAVNKEQDVLDDPSGYWYSFDWNLKSKFRPEFLPAFGKGDGKSSEILYIKRISSQPIFALPDYQSGIQYCEVEQELSNFFVKHIKNSFSVGTIVNINQGETDSEEAMEDAKNAIINKLTGTSGDRIIVAFNDNKENATTVENITIDDAYQKFDFVSKEATSKIMLAHKVNDPGLFGLPTPSGFASEADKMVQSLKLLYRSQINPMREMLTDGLEKAFQINDPSIQLEFQDFEELKVEEISEEEQPTTDLNMNEEIDLTDEEGESILDNLVGEVVDDEWELVDSRECSEENESQEDWANRLIKSNVKLATINEKPNSSSYLDKSSYKVRYSYTEGRFSVNSRKFCREMMLKTSSGVVYRLEDIDNASMKGVNGQFAHSGGKYDLFKFKGGKNCGHYWSEVLYRLKKNTSGSPDKLSNSDEVDSIPKSYVPTPVGNARSKQTEISRSDKGAYPG
jgi:hypothetical protein